MVEKHVSAQLGDRLQIGAQACQREAFFSWEAWVFLAVSACRSLSTVTFDKAVSVNSLLCLTVCEQMKQINRMEKEARIGVSWQSLVSLS